MGVKIYWIIAALVIVFGMILPQEGPRKRYYIILIAAIHTFFCGFRYMYIFGDLIKYATSYYAYADGNYSLFSDAVFDEGRNAGFQWISLLFAKLTNGDYQVFLFALALFCQIAVAVLIYRHSPKPWLSYLVWNCMSFYVTYDYCAIKQGLAMAVLMFAFSCALEKKPIGFYMLALLAGFIHTPALIVLPAYWLMNRRVDRTLIVTYLIFAALVYIFRSQIVLSLSDLYYEGNDEIDFSFYASRIGGRTALIVLIAVTGMLLKGFRELRFQGLFNLMVMAAIIQMFSMYDNVFTRLADYYFQFSVLYIPMIFFEQDHPVPVNHYAAHPLLPFNRRSTALIVFFLVIALLWWYHYSNLGQTITYEVDNYLNFRFMWDVARDVV